MLEVKIFDCNPVSEPSPKIARRGEVGMVRDGGVGTLVLTSAVLAALFANAAGRVVTESPAREQELFHTPYRQEDSRHFQVKTTFKTDGILP